MQVPLVVFKREKEIARLLEFEGLYIVEQPSDDDIKGQWDKLVLSTQSFPDRYWDKFVKKKVSSLLHLSSYLVIAPNIMYFDKSRYQDDDII